MMCSRDYYRCKSQTCGDNGGVCELSIPTGYIPPQSCVNPECFDDDCCEPDCKWEQIFNKSPEFTEDIVEKLIAKGINHGIECGIEQGRNMVLDELIRWLEPQKIELLKQRMWRKLKVMRSFQKS